MRELLLDLPKDRRPHYLRIAEAVRAAIQAGRVRPGEALPSTRALARGLRVHRHTVMAALEELSAEGWLVASPRRSHRISGQLPDELLRARAPAALPPGRPLSWRLARTAPEPAPYSPRAYRHNFRSGLPDLRLFPFAELRSHIGDSLRRSRPAAFGIGDPSGHEPLIQELEGYLRRVRAMTGRRLIVTNGSQEGLFLAAQVLLKPGDWVAVEHPGYPAAWDAFRAAGARLAPVPVDGQGLDVASLERVASRRRLRLIYVTPLHQYPTTATLPAGRRLALYELARRRRIPILEDDYDHEFHFATQPPAPLASQDPAGLVIHVATFSKVLFPSARLGFIAAPEGLYPALRAYRGLMTRQTNVLMQDSLARWMRSGGFERHLRRMRRAYAERAAAVIAALERARRSIPELSWRPIEGGMAAWVEGPGDSDAACRRAAALGVYAQPESGFRLDGRPGLGLRLGFASQSPWELTAGLELLARALAGSFSPHKP